MQLQDKFLDEVKTLIQRSQEKSNEQEDANSVLQFANLENRKIVEGIIDKLILKGSGIHPIERLHTLYDLAKQGKSVLFFSEHYSNFDIPVIFYLIQKLSPYGKDITDKIIALATRRLNEHSVIVRAFAECYNRITVYAARDVVQLNKEEAAAEHKYAQELNKSALSHVAHLKENGYIIFIFPAGTRYRPGKPETKVPIPQVVSFIKRFDYLMFAGIDGLLLKVDPEGNMASEESNEDVVSISLGEVMECKKFCNDAIAAYPDMDSKESILKFVTKNLDNLHQQAVDLRETHIT